jgi:PEP-CTERM motif
LEKGNSVKLVGVLAPGVLVAGILVSVSSANAGVVLSDNFDSDTATLNWPGDSVFQSIPQPGNVAGLPSVDLVSASDGFANLVFHGNSVDLDGTTGSGNSPAGELQSITSLSTGSYTVQFEFAGNERGAPPETTVVSIGNQSFSLTPPNSQGYTLTTLFFTNVSDKLSFTDLGPSDQQGNLIDNVVVTTGVPEPSTWAMMVLGFAGLGYAAFRRSNGKSRLEGVIA